MAVQRASPQSVTQIVSGEAAQAPYIGPSGLKKAWESVEPTMLGLSSILLLLALWQFVTHFGFVNTMFLSPPSAVMQAMFDLAVSGDLVFHMKISAEELLYGLGISIVLGAVLGVITGWYARAEQFFRPIVVGINSMPHIAVIPVLILLLGIGLAPKIMLVVLSCTVTILMNTAAGVMNVDSQLMRMSRSFGSTDLQAIRTVVVPSMIPFFMTGIRISVGRALVAVVASEFFASKAGVGNVIITAANSFNMPRMYAMLIIVTALGIALTQGATWVEMRIQRWRG